MNQLPKKLQEARDSDKNHEADLAWQGAIDKYDSTKGELVYEYGFRHGFDSGFDSCYKILAPEIEKLVEALKSIQSGWECSACSCACHDKPKEVLKGWRGFTGEK